MTAYFMRTVEKGIPQFDKIFVISDLHLGGVRGFQIFNSGTELKKLIDHIRTLSEDEHVALIINGDFIDFLAEPRAEHFDPVGATRKLERIVNDGAFASAWKALKNLVSTPNRSLVVNLGNHDIELALPWVRARLLSLLAGADDAARGRITLAFDGTGFLCSVGNARVLCVHGNEVDDWNVVDYETIRRCGRDMQQGRAVESWVPNAGSQLVIDVMNDLKTRYPFVDLLKPEMQAVVPTLAALAPDQRDKLRATAAVAGRLAWDKLRRATGFLSAEEEDAARRAAARVGKAAIRPGSASRSAAGDLSVKGEVEFGGRKHAEALMAQAEDRFRQGIRPMSLIGDDERGQYLGFRSALVKLARGADVAEALREALKDLGEDRSFELHDEDKTFRELDELIGDNADFVIAGHTHLARALPRRKGRGWYFNSGTWARLIKLEKQVLDDEARFRAVFDTFSEGTMDALDAHPGLVLRRLTVVALWTDGVRTRGELHSVGTASADPLLSQVPNTCFSKV